LTPEGLQPIGKRFQQESSGEKADPETRGSKVRFAPDPVTRRVRCRDSLAGVKVEEEGGEGVRSGEKSLGERVGEIVGGEEGGEEAEGEGEGEDDDGRVFADC